MNKETYRTMKERHQQEFGKLPLMAAFSNDQFEAGKKELQITSNDQLLSMGNGCFIRRSDKSLFIEHFERTNAEREAAMRDSDFCVSAFVYEMQNHEYGYTGNIAPVLDALDLTPATVNASDVLQKALQAALKQYKEQEQ